MVLTACESNMGSSNRSSLENYGANAEEAYTRALSEFRSDDCLAAEPMFRSVRRHYPYSRFAALSELRIADCKLKQDLNVEAIAAYRQFIRFRPSHDLVPYARFQVAFAHYDEIPTEWLLSPPTHQRDQRKVHEALRQLRRFILDHPEHERVAEAREMERRCLNILAEHELYAARFYARRDAHSAVILRLRTLLNSYSGSEVEPEALLLLADALTAMNEPSEANEALQELVERFPDSEEAGNARTRLAN